MLPNPEGIAGGLGQPQQDHLPSGGQGALVRVAAIPPYHLFCPVGPGTWDL